MESLDAHDYKVLARLGYAVGRAQLFEHAMLKLVEAQRHDLAVPVDDRWPEIEGWLTTWTGGKIAQELHVPQEIAEDLRIAVKRRNVVAHHAWRLYIAARAKNKGEAVTGYCDWLDGEARVLGKAYNALISILTVLRASPSPLPAGDVVAIWRGQVSSPIELVGVPWPDPTPESDATAAKLIDSEESARP